VQSSCHLPAAIVAPPSRTSVTVRKAAPHTRHPETTQQAAVACALRGEAPVDALSTGLPTPPSPSSISPHASAAATATASSSRLSMGRQSSPPHDPDVMPPAAAAATGRRKPFDLARARLAYGHTTVDARRAAHGLSRAHSRHDDARRPPPYDGSIPATFVNGAGPAIATPPATVPQPPPQPEFWVKIPTTKAAPALDPPPRVDQPLAVFGITTRAHTLAQVRAAMFADIPP
jgi:hypothetical protein